MSKKSQNIKYGFRQLEYNNIVFVQLDVLIGTLLSVDPKKI